MNDVDIVLVKPGSQKQLYGSLSDFQLTAIEPPFWAALLAAFLRKQGYSVTLLDAEVLNLNYAETAQAIEAAKPHLTAIIVSGTNPSASTMNMTGALKITTELKQLNPNRPTLLGGLHPSALPKHTISYDDVDFVCQGEGFVTLPALINALKSKRILAIPGLWYKQEGQPVFNAPARLWEDLSTLPPPAWDLLPMQDYRAHNWHCFDHLDQRAPYAVLYTSLGCPFSCSFCCINAIFGKQAIRYREIPDIIREIDYLVKHFNIKNIKIIDEMFALNETRVVDLCDAIIQRGYDLNLWAYARINTVTPKMLAKMKSAGINWVAYGFESGNQGVITDVSKGFHLENVMAVVQETYQLDMHICANFIFGLPQDNYDTMNQTLELMFDINAEWANIYSAMAFPGSKLYQQALENDWLLPDSWEAYSQYNFESLPLQTQYLSGGQVLAFRDYAFHTYYESPRYLNMIRQKFGEAVMDHIQSMSKKRLNRKHACV